MRARRHAHHTTGKLSHGYRRAITDRASSRGEELRELRELLRQDDRMDRIFRMTAWHSRIARNEPEEKGERLSRTVASRAAVPFSSLGRWCAEPDDQTDIFVSILSIPAILSGSSRRCSAVIRPARRAFSPASQGFLMRPHVRAPARLRRSARNDSPSGRPATHAARPGGARSARLSARSRAFEGGGESAR